MAPNSIAVAQEGRECKIEDRPVYKVQIIWSKVLILAILYVIFVYGFLYLQFTSCMWKTLIFTYTYGYCGALGITAGYHRLWSHRSYKARWPLRALLCILASIAGERDIYEWCRDHRVHHKFTETDADPHNIKRGVFFAHIGWLMCKKHPAVKEKGKTVYLDDLLADPIVRFHKRFYMPMFILFSFCLPAMIPVWFWGETMWNSVITSITVYCFTFNMSCLVNSAAHCLGNKPFDKHIEARENAFVSFMVIGEAWHNYHHVFPWDYAASELGTKLNLTKKFIDLMVLIGLAYDCKTVHPEMVERQKLKAGDGTGMKYVEMPEEETFKTS